MNKNHRFENGTYILESGCAELGTIRISGIEPIICRHCRKGGKVSAEAKPVSENQVEMSIRCDGACNGNVEKLLASDRSSLF